MGLKEAFRKVGQAIEETKMKIGMKKYKKGGIQIEEKDQKTEKVIPINDIPLPEEKKETEDAEIRKIEDLPAYEDRKFYIAAKMQVEPEEVEKVIRKTEAEWKASQDQWSVPGRTVPASSALLPNISPYNMQIQASPPAALPSCVLVSALRNASGPL